MARDIEITRITSTSFAYEIADMELEEQLGFDTVLDLTRFSGQRISFRERSRL